MERLIGKRRVSRYKRRYGDMEMHLTDICQTPILTKRDKDVLVSLYYHKVLTTEQITDIHFSYDAKGEANSQAAVIARRRLRKLFDYQLVERFFVAMGEGNGSSQSHVMLDSLGAKIVGGLLNWKDMTKWRTDFHEAQLPYLEHSVSINDFYIWLLRHARTCGHELGYFKAEVRHSFTHWGEDMLVNPDAYGQYFTGDEGFHFFLEVDRGTMSPSSFQKKHRRYSAFYDSKDYVDQYGTFPMVLTVVPSEERLLSLHDAIYKRDNTDLQWLFTTAAQAKEDPVGTIWIGKDKKPVSLV